MSASISAVNEKIIDETAKLTAEYRRQFDGRPDDELRAWLHIAAQREGMVRQVYGAIWRAVRLADRAEGAARAAWDVVSEIWQEEAVHTELITLRLAEGLMAVGNPLTGKIRAFIGDVEGRILSALTDERPTLSQALARMLTEVGGKVNPKRVPAFTKELKALNNAEFFRLAGALEMTAKQSYQRMNELLGVIEGGARPSVQRRGLRRALVSVRRDEEFHERAFAHMTGWMDVQGQFDPTLDQHKCVQEVADLLPQAGYERQGAVLTDGGLGNLFRRYGIELEVVGETPPTPSRPSRPRRSTSSRALR